MLATVVWPPANSDRHPAHDDDGTPQSVMSPGAASPAVVIAVATLLAVLFIMLGEAALSVHNERLLRARGAIEPPDDVIDTMRWAYPGSFVAMAVEGAWAGPASVDALAAGLAVFGFAKALKTWAIATLGTRWTFRVLVLPNAPLIARGPYALLRHPNYVAVMGEIIGMALLVWAPVTGTLSVVGFGWLLLRRMAVEDRALGRE
jgi:methyltransferase